jgi:AcrR family transcriptional regulator
MAPMPHSLTGSTPTRQRVPAAERRDALIEAAIHEFAHTGLHGTPVDRIARRVGVAQPYVFSLFGSKRELFLAAIERCFADVSDWFTAAWQAFDPAIALPDTDAMTAMGHHYVERLASDHDHLMLQLQAYAACDDDVIRDRVRSLYARLVDHVQRLTGAEQERIDEFFRYGMWLNAAAAMGVPDLSVGCEWVRAEVAEDAEDAKDVEDVEDARAATGLMPAPASSAGSRN